jgi:hypothetical protein
MQKIQDAFDFWLKTSNHHAYHPLDNDKFFALALAIASAVKSKNPEWSELYGAEWLEEQLPSPQFSEAEKQKLGLTLEKLVEYELWRTKN